ncbi:MAG: DNA repair protein RadA [Microscillaceae bacterium]|nr:DNA repair protein RadA [Microscillaceae bacterium]
MNKVKTNYFCQKCGYQSPKWLGKCPACEEWNTFVEEVLQKEIKEKKGEWRVSTSQKVAHKPRSLEEINPLSEHRLVTPDKELNRVLGGGIVPGSLVLIGGEPGIGKSTLMLQIALQLSHLKVLYVSGEESEQQIKMRAERLKVTQTANTPQEQNEIPESGCYILTETATQNIFKQVEIFEPHILVVDSIQTLHSAFVESGAGSVSQVRECTAELMKFAKESSTPVFLIGHITKEGNIAGPKVLEHMVDTVLQFEGDRHLVYRILRATKNRFGSTSELGIYEMLGDGLREVSNPSEILISQREEDISGISIGATLEGNRPLLIEVQSLVSVSSYGTPQRSSTGFDGKRLNMLLAVLEKRGGFRLGTQDVFLNITGGLKIEDPAIDLAVCVSIISSYEDTIIPADTCFAAEVGLGGEVRAVNKIEQRISEAEKLGFKKIYVSRFSMKSIHPDNYKIQIRALGKLEEIFTELFV